MIYVSEIIPLKLSGRSSLLIKFDFNQEIIDILKYFQPAVFHKKLQAWEISIIYLSKVLDELTRFDDIELKLLKDIDLDSYNNLTEPEIKDFKYKPFEHQIEAINYGLEKKKWLNLSSMGLGKSLEGIYLAETLHNRGLIEHCLIICGVDSLRQNWKAEIQKFSKESCVVLGERLTKSGKITYDTLVKRAEQLINPIEEFFIIVNITNIRDDKFIDAFKKSKNNIGLIIFDECHRCLTGDTIIQTDAGNIQIGELAKFKNFPKILSFNKKTDKKELDEIVSIYESLPTEPIIEIEIIDDSGKINKLKCTESHKIYTNNRGWVKAKDLTFEDDIKIIS